MAQALFLEYKSNVEESEVVHEVLNERKSVYRPNNYKRPLVNNNFIREHFENKPQQLHPQYVLQARSSLINKIVWEW